MLPPLKPRRKDGGWLRKRNKGFLLWLTEKELNLIKYKAKKAGMSEQHFVRNLICGCRVYEAPPVDFARLIREINRVGSNIDQLLRIANAKKLLDVPRLRKELDELDAIEDAMWKAFAPDGR